MVGLNRLRQMRNRDLALRIAETGAVQAGEDFDCDVEVRMPPQEGGRAANQKRMLEQLISMGVDGIVVRYDLPVGTE